MATTFETTEINGMTLANRLVRSATCEALCAPDGRPTPELNDYYRELARGGVGLIISGYTYVRPEGKQTPGKMGLCDDNSAAEMKALTEAVHDEGGKLCIQLVHAGGQASPDVSGHANIAPSAVEVAQFSEVPNEMSADDIAGVIAAFGAAAGRAKAYGFDAVELHGAHGYLISQFLSPLTNRRTDDYGGSVENRTRFGLEVYQAVRAAVGPDFPVGIKLNGDDFLEGGLSAADALHAAKTLDAASIDFIEVSCGTPASGKFGPARSKVDSPEREAYNLPLAEGIKGAVSCAVMTVGGLRSPEVIEKVLSEGRADYVALSRPFVRQPDLPKQWKAGSTETATCISCNGCFIPLMKGEPIYCVMDK